MKRNETSGMQEERKDSFDSDNEDGDDDRSYNDDSSSDTESSIDSFASDSASSQRSFPEETLYQHTRSIVRRRAVSPLDASSSSSSANHVLDEHRGRDTVPSVPRTTTAANGRRRRGTERRRRTREPQTDLTFFQECFYFYRDACPPMLCNGRVNSTLLFCFSLWCAVQLRDAWRQTSHGDPMNAVRKYSTEARNRLRNRDEQGLAAASGGGGRRNAEPNGLWGKAAEQLEWLMPNPRPKVRRKSRRKGDNGPKECQPAQWHTLSFPNCNEIHELDLREELGLRRRARHRRDGGAAARMTQSKNSTDTFGYVASGLWRTVFKIHGRGNTTLALKMMKGEHDVDKRNLDRHRRDAISMERLTASPNVVSIYGYCGNTVLTEHLVRSLDTLIFHDGDMKQSDTVATRQSPLGRLRLALYVARGIAAIHDIPGGPIVHADIQPKQFLVDSQGVVKLNDFNRCRFVPTNNHTGTPCPITIPSAPGGNRAPEEYNSERLTEKLDIFSTAHVLYAILTGEKPWDDLWGSQVKKLVKAGKKPPIVDKNYLKPGTSDSSLANLIDLAYEFDPQDRPSASKLVAELEHLVATESAKHQDSDNPSSSL